MAIEEQVIQPDSVNPAEQPVADTPSQPQAPDLSSIKAEYEAKPVSYTHLTLPTILPV